MEILYWMFEMGATFIEGYMLLVVTGALLKEERTSEVRRREIGIAIIDMIVVILFNQIELVSVVTVIMMITTLLCCQRLLLKRNIVRCMVILFIYYAVLVAIDYACLILFEYIFNMSIGTIVGNLGYERLFAITVSKGLLVIVTELVCYAAWDFRKLYIEKHKALLLLLFMISVTPVMQVLEYNKNNYIGASDFLGNFTCIVGILILIKYLIQNEERQEQEIALSVQKAKNELLENSLQELEKSFFMWKTSVHDYKHVMLYITMLIENNRIEQLQEYLAVENSKMEMNSHYYKTENPMLDVIINTKAKTMRDKGISLTVQIDIGQGLYIAERDLGILFGNLLDNAIEAAEKCKEAYILLTVKCFSKIAEIEIVNSYNGKENVDFQTTKTDKTFHGIGLQSVAEIVERYDGQMDKGVDRDEVMVRIVLSNEGR